MIEIGEFSLLNIVRKSPIGYFLDAKTGDTADDILLPISNTEHKELNVGDSVNAFIYRDSKDRIISTLKKPLAKVGDIAYLIVVAQTKIGAFINIGLERDVFVPIKEQSYKLEIGNKYLFFIYLDKTGRIAATADIERRLDNIELESEEAEKYSLGSEVEGIAYGYQTNGSVMVAMENRYRAIILKNEYFVDIKPGDEISARIKKIYEDGKVGLTPRKIAVEERVGLEEEIMKYLADNDGFMIYNDKSSPEEIKQVFSSSKNYFKNALGGLMRKGLVKQDENGTKLIKEKMKI